MKEITRPYMVRLYKRHHSIIKKSARKLKMTDAEFVRHALEVAEVRTVTG
jgi:hypothetical protein